MDTVFNVFMSIQGILALLIICCLLSLKLRGWIHDIRRCFRQRFGRVEQPTELLEAEVIFCNFHIPVDEDDEELEDVETVGKNVTDSTMDDVKIARPRVMVAVNLDDAMDSV